MHVIILPECLFFLTNIFVLLNESRDIVKSNKVYVHFETKVINFVLEKSLFFLNIVVSTILALRIMKDIADDRIILANFRVVSICVTANANVDETL